MEVSQCQYAVIAGAGHGIGLELVRYILQNNESTVIFSTYRTKEKAEQLFYLKKIYAERLQIHHLTHNIEQDYIGLSEKIGLQTNALCLLINCIGYLHGENNQPEKRLEDIDPQNFMYSFSCNTMPSLLLAKHLKPYFKVKKPATFVSLSARVGSIGDNRSGGWYGYRSSKAALNMSLKTIAIEFKRMKSLTTVLALHPGTTDTELSKPFTSRTKYTLHSAAETAENLLGVIGNISLSESGGFYDWRGQPIEW